MDFYHGQFHPTLYGMKRFLHDGAGFSQFYTTGDTGKQHAVQLLLQLADLLTQCLLGNVQGFCSCRKVQKFGKNQKIFDLYFIQHSSLSGIIPDGKILEHEMNKYQTLATNTLLMSMGTFGSKLLVFLMVRFYTGYLTPAEYGTADLITQTANLLIPLVSLDIADAVFRFVADRRSGGTEVFRICGDSTGCTNRIFAAVSLCTLSQ